MISTTEDANYYGLVRDDIMPLLPERIGRILDVGCGYGNTLAWIRENKGCEWAGGVEIIPEAAEKAKGKMDIIYWRAERQHEPAARRRRACRYSDDRSSDLLGGPLSAVRRARRATKRSERSSP